MVGCLLLSFCLYMLICSCWSELRRRGVTEVWIRIGLFFIFLLFLMSSFYYSFALFIKMCTIHSVTGWFFFGLLSIQYHSIQILPSLHSIFTVRSLTVCSFIKIKIPWVKNTFFVIRRPPFYNHISTHPIRNKFLIRLTNSSRDVCVCVFFILIYMCDFSVFCICLFVYSTLTFLYYFFFFKIFCWFP